MKILLFGIVLFFSRCNKYQGDYEPIYMTYDELRSSIELQVAKPILERGKIYLYQNFIFVNEPNQGIHIVDNSDPKNPKQLHFIKIPGNIDIAIKDDILYADSFIDLVAIDISKEDEIKIAKREVNIFDYDPYQMIKDEEVYFTDYDEEKGVIIGFKERK